MGKTAIDLFCGIGGFSLGLEREGFKVLCGIDKNEEIIDIYNYNQKHKGFSYNLTNDPSNFFDYRPNEAQVDLVVGGPPCQGFSTANSNWDEDDERNNLVFNFLKWVKYIRPKSFIMENVPGILSLDGGKTPNKIQELAKDIGFDVNIKKLKAIDYGMVQNRKRVFFVGTKENVDFNWPNKNKIKDINSYKIIKDLPKIGEGGGKGGFLEHISPNSSKDVIERFKNIPQGCDWQSLPNELMTKVMKEGRAHGNIYYRIDPSTYVPTIANFAKAMMIHPFEDRIISIREAMRYQTMPDDFDLLDKNRTLKYQVIANLVPVKLGKKVIQGLDYKD